jgi:hypothetical protein
LPATELGPASDEEIADARALQLEHAELQAALSRASGTQVPAFARVVLVAHVLAGGDDEVERAIDAAGQKALLLEIAVVGLLGLGLLHGLTTRGRKRTVTETTVTFAPDGTVTVKTTETVEHYSASSHTAPPPPPPKRSSASRRTGTNAKRRQRRRPPGAVETTAHPPSGCGWATAIGARRERSPWRSSSSERIAGEAAPSG